MGKLICLFLLFLTPVIHAQKTISGIILDVEKRQPIPNASVFLSNTFNGTRADDGGHFQLAIPPGKYDLVVSSIGYSTFSMSVSYTDTISRVTILLSPKVEEMETVVIEPWLKNGWEVYGRLFTDFFIGTTPEAKSCKIKNQDAIRFRLNKKTNVLEVSSLEPIVIENKSLGYILQYQLEAFEYSYETRYLIYTGYPFFITMNGNKSQENKWQKNRASVYYGSMMHFMRCIYLNQLKEQGFEVRNLKWIPNTERERVKNLLIEFSNKSNSFLSYKTLSKDSSNYYDKVVKQPDHYEIVGKNVLPGDSVAYGITEYKAGLYFPDLLLVIYTKKPAPVEYTRLYPDNGRSMMSRITLVHGVPIEIEARGNYYDPAELLSYGYWAWSEKISTMLPLDYEVRK